MELFQEFPLSCCFLCWMLRFWLLSSYWIFFYYFFLFSRKTSPEHIPGDTEGAESRARLQETSASGSLNGKLVKLHQIHVKVVTEVEIIILYSVLSKGRMNAMEMLRNYLKRKRWASCGLWSSPSTSFPVPCLLCPCTHSHVLTRVFNSQCQSHPSVNSKEIITLPGRKRDGKCFWFGFGMSDRGWCAFCGGGGCGQALHLYK